MLSIKIFKTCHICLSSIVLLVEGKSGRKRGCVTIIIADSETYKKRDSRYDTERGGSDYNAYRNSMAHRR